MLEQPIFVVGAGRSGSSVFHEMFAEHPRVAWMSTLCDRHPERLARHRMLMRCVDLPGIGGLLRRHWESAECYDFWDRFFRGFSESCRDLRADDATPFAKRRLQNAVERLVTKRRPRLLVKVTGWPRIGFLHAVFPDARFVHVYRDGRAVANSLLQVDFWRGWRGPAQWRWGQLDSRFQQEWEAHDRSFVALAAIQWKILMQAAEAAIRAVPAASVMNLRYENFAERPVETFREVAEFCNLEWSSTFEGRLSRYSVESANYKWKKDLDQAQQATLLAVLGEELHKYGYT